MKPERGDEQPMTVAIRANVFDSPATRQFVLGLLLAVATVAVYYPVNRYQFVNYDDDTSVTNNLHVKYGLDWDGVKWAFTTFHVSNWVPLTWLSHALDCEIFGLNPGRLPDIFHEVRITLKTRNHQGNSALPLLRRCSMGGDGHRAGCRCCFGLRAFLGRCNQGSSLRSSARKAAATAPKARTSNML
jgi:hypothetical protein